MKRIFTVILSSVILVSAAIGQENNGSSIIKQGNNNIKIVPITIFDVGVGVGLTYERFLDKQQKISVVIPIDYLFADFDGGNSFYGSEDNKTSYFYFSPGLKFYPASANKKVTYAIGPNLYFGFGEGSNWVYQGFSGYYSYENYNNTRFGVLATNYLDINVTPSFNLGFSLAVGLRYSSSYNNDYNYSMDNREGVTPVAQFKFTMGYRF